MRRSGRGATRPAGSAGSTSRRATRATRCRRSSPGCASSRSRATCCWGWAAPALRRRSCSVPPGRARSTCSTARIRPRCARSRPASTPTTRSSSSRRSRARRSRRAVISITSGARAGASRPSRIRAPSSRRSGTSAASPPSSGGADDRRPLLRALALRSRSGALMGLDVDRLMDGAVEMQEACRTDRNPGLDLGLALGHDWLEGRDKVVVPETNGFGLWLEQLLAESTGKDGRASSRRLARRRLAPTARRATRSAASVTWARSSTAGSSPRRSPGRSWRSTRSTSRTSRRPRTARSRSFPATAGV